LSVFPPPLFDHYAVFADVAADAASLPMTPLYATRRFDAILLPAFSYADMLMPPLCRAMSAA